MELVNLNVTISGMLVKKSFKDKSNGQYVDWYYLLDEDGAKTKVSATAYKALVEGQVDGYRLYNGRISFGEF